MTTLISITGMWVATRRFPVEPRIRLLLNATLGMATLQVTLGISTLLTYVPASLGAAHQAGALTLFTIVLALMHSLRRPLSTSLATAQLSQQHKSLLKAWK
jgi:cytochrome c oxidase assembly protein subunit 15